MEIDDLIIENISKDNPNDETESPLAYFKKGEWKKALTLTRRVFSDPKTQLSTKIEIYKSGCSLACKLSESRHVKLGIKLTKALNKLIPEEHIQSFIQYQCEVLNYIACSYKESLNLYMAKKYIDKAMLIIKDFPNINWDKSRTYLNMCAILSALGKHFEASEYAKTAISLAKEELVLMKFSQEAENISKKAAVLAIAFHNYAVEEEFLGNFQVALDFYEKAYKFLKSHDSNNEEMIEKFKNSYLEVRKIRKAKTRPNSAKSSASSKSVKSLASVKNLSKPVTRRPKEKVTKSASKTDFLEFKNECQNFLEKKSQWACFDAAITRLKEAPKVQIKIKPHHPGKDLTDFRPVKAEIVQVPARGVENVRKPVVHEIARQKQGEVPEILFEDKRAEFLVSEKNEAIEVSSMKFLESDRGPPQKVYVSREAPKDFPKLPNFNIKGAAKGLPVNDSNLNEIQETSQKTLLENQEKFLNTAKPVFFEAEERTEEVFTEKAKSISKAEKKTEKIFAEKAKFEVKEKKLVELNEDFIKKLRKVQARVRGMIAREKYSLLKKKPKILYRGGKKIGKSRYFINVVQKNDKKIVLINDRNDEIKISAPVELSGEAIFNMLDKNDQGFFFKKTTENEGNELIKNKKLKLEDDYYDVNYFYNKESRVLAIKATKYSNSRVFSLEKHYIAFNSKALVLRYINDEIEPFLSIENLKLIINKQQVIIEREFLATGSRILYKKDYIFTIYRVATNEGYFLEVLGQAKDDKKEYSELIPVEEVLKNIKTFNINDLHQDPHAIILTLHIHEDRIALRKLERTWLKVIFSEEKQFNNENFSVKVYKVHYDAVSYFFAVTNPAFPKLSSLSISDKDLAGLFKIKLKKIKSSMSDIVNGIKVKPDFIAFDTRVHKATTLLASEIKIIVKIQSFIRGHLLRDRNRLQNAASSLIYSIVRTFDDHPTAFNFFKVKDAIFVEALFSDLNKSFYLFVDKPKNYFTRFSRLYDIKCLANTIIFDMKTFLLPSLRGNIKFLECSYYASEELRKSDNFPVMKFKLNTPSDYILLIRPLENGIIAKVMKLTSKPVCDFRVFTREEIEKSEGKYSVDGFARKIEFINGSIGHTSQVVQKKYQIVTTSEKVIYRTTIKFEDKLYSVTLAVESNEIMVFQFRHGSVSEQTIYVNLEEAYEMSGFSEGYVIPMTLFMIKKMFFVEDGKIVLKPPVEKFDVKKSLSKIEAFIKGFRTRFNFRDKLNFKLITKSPVKLDGHIYKVLFYFCSQDFNVCVMDYPLVLTAKLNNKKIRNHEEKIEKLFLSKILPKIRIKEKNGKKKIGGLQQWKKDYSQSFSNVFLEANTPFSTNRSNSESVLKVLRWRSPREISGKNCVVSVYEIANAGLIEVLDLSNDQTFTLEVEVSLISDPSFLASQLHISANTLSIKSHSIKVLLTDKRFISNKLAEISIFSTEKGVFASALLVEENKTLNSFIGNEIDPAEAIKSLKIKEVMGQEVLIIT